MFILKQSSLASILFLSVVVSAFDNCTNRTPLGMRNGFIRADQLSASSQYNDEYSANAGRLSSANGWCTNEYKDQSLEWYQVQFDYVTILTGIALQGGVYVDNYITKFTLQYSLKENGDLVTFLNGQIFDGVSKNTDVAYVWFLYSIAALRIRVFANGLGTNKHMCLRIELFGCLNYTLEEMGMESEIIADSQIIVSNGMAASSARMNTKSEGLYSSGNLNVTVDLKNVMMVDAVAIKGSSNYLLGKNFVKSYWVHLGNNTNNQKLIDEYPGNIKNGVSPALSFLNTTQVGSVIKIQSKEVSKDKNYMTLEVYGKHSICADLLPLDNVNMSSKVYFTVMNAYIDSPFTWCATFEDKKPFIMIELRQVYLVSGINVQGDSNKDAWVKSFELSFGILKNKMYPTNEVYKGSIGRIFPYSLNWFSRLMLAKYIRVTLKDWENECCMRVHVRGCLKALDAPSELLIKEDINGELLLEWKKPEFAPISVQKYVISVESIKPYNNSFFFSNSYETSSNTKLSISVDFHAALFNISIDVFYDEDYYARGGSLQYYSKPTSPPAPFYEVFYSFNGYTEVFECQFYSVSDVNGPVSFYEIIISEKEVSSLEMKTLTLRDQITAKSLNLSYFLASSFSSKNFVTRSLKFYEGLETVDGLNVSLPTIASLFLYIRAVIKPSEENYSNMTYYGNVMKWNIVRKTLPQKELQWDKSVGHVIELVKGPPNTL